MSALGMRNYSMPAPFATLPEEPVVGDVETFLKDLIMQLEPEAPESGARGRPRILSNLCLWAGILVCVLRGFSGQREVWRLLAHKGFWHFPRLNISDQAVYKRLDEESFASFERLFWQVSALLRPRLAPYADHTLAPFATGVYSLDASTPDKLARLLKELRGKGKTQKEQFDLLAGKLHALFDLRYQQWFALRFKDDPKEHDSQQAETMLSFLPKGSLLLADLGYFAFEWFDRLTKEGYYWVSRYKEKVSYEIIHTFYQHGETIDALVWLGKHRSDRAGYAVRFVQFREGKHLRRYFTNVLDPKLLPMHEIARLYLRRWDIEMAFCLIKRHLNLHLLKTGKVQVLLVQLWAVLLISQILQALRLEIAGRAGVDTFDVSMELLVRYVPRLVAQGEDPIEVFVTRGRQLEFIRPSRRLKLEVPPIDLAAIMEAPPDLVLERKARYAHKP